MEKFVWSLDGITINLDIPTVIIIVLALLLFYMMWRASKAGRLDWTDMITSKAHKVSLTKFLQLIGGITATWIMVYMTLNGKLGGELLMTYLAYVGAIEGWSKFVAARYGGPPSDSASYNTAALDDKHITPPSSRVG